MSGDVITGRDVYLRYNKGPAQHFRAWDAERFIASQVKQGAEAKDGPVVVTVATRDEYMAERRKERK